MGLIPELAFLVISFAATTYGIQPSAPEAIPAPLRELPWGQLNILQSTDTHGWHAGHLQEASYSADWGDYISFAKHLRDRADKDGTDLLLVDTGDKIEGNGLYDAANPPGKYTYDIFKNQEIDVICSGNHELYKATSAQNEYDKTVPYYKSSYISSNLDIKLNDTDGKFVPLARRYRKFTTKNQKIRITAFGFLYNFQQAAENVKVKMVEDVIEEEWFQDAIRDRDTDLFLVTGHVAIRSQEYDMIFNAIRSVQWNTPIFFVGGHTHIRDFKNYDSKAAAIESGRYMETIGFASIDGLRTEKDKKVTLKSKQKFARRYIDNNLYSFHHHTGLNKSTFPTELGRNVSQQIAEARKKLDLDHTYGCAPRTLWTNRVGIDHENSIFDWLRNEVLPAELSEEAKNATPKLVITNTGAMRFDLFKGPFTRDTTYIISPFTSGFRYLKDVDYEAASQVLRLLNNQGPMLHDLDPKLDFSLLPSRPPQIQANPTSTFESLLYDNSDQQPLNTKPSLIPGYTTKDDAGEDGDDTEHSPISFQRIPNCIESKVDFPVKGEEVKSVDIVYNEFIEAWIILALRFLGRKYDHEDTAAYLQGKTMTNVISDWVKKNWPCDDS